MANERGEVALEKNLKIFLKGGKRTVEARVSR
jgi:hypothetical protein